MGQIRELTNSVISSLNRQDETKCGVTVTSQSFLDHLTNNRGKKKKERERKAESNFNARESHCPCVILMQLGNSL